MSNDDSSLRPIVPRGITLPPRKDTKGRGPGNGEWLEWELGSAFKRWGYSVAWRETVYGLEVDLIGRRKNPVNRPSDWIVAECKDWKNKNIPERVLYRLCMLAFTCQAVPVLCTTSELTTRAAKIAHHWEVRVLSYPDLQRGTLPGPQILDFRGRPYQPAASGSPESMRERRGRLPFMFDNHPIDGLSYVPGYEPIGKYAQYRPTTISRKRE